MAVLKQNRDHLFYYQLNNTITNRKAKGLTLIGIAAICISISIFFLFRATSDIEGGGIRISDSGYINWDVLQDYAAISGIIGAILGAVGAWHLISMKKDA